MNPANTNIIEAFERVIKFSDNHLGMYEPTNTNIIEAFERVVKSSDSYLAMFEPRQYNIHIIDTNLPILYPK